MSAWSTWLCAVASRKGARKVHAVMRATGRHTSGIRFGSRQGPCDFADAGTVLEVLDPAEIAAKLQQGSLLARQAFEGPLAPSVKEVVQSDTELRGESPLPAGGNRVLFSFILLHLLVCDPNG